MKKMLLILSACLFCLVSCSSPSSDSSSSTTDNATSTTTTTTTTTNPTQPSNPTNPTDTPTTQVQTYDVIVYVARPNINGAVKFTINDDSTVYDVIHKLQFEYNVFRTYRTAPDGTRMYLIYPTFYYWSLTGEHINKNDSVKDLIDNHEGSNNRLSLYTVWTECMDGRELGDLESY